MHHWWGQYRNAVFRCLSFKMNDNFWKGHWGTKEIIYRIEKALRWASFSSTEFCFQHRGWSFVSIGKPTDGWNDMGMEMCNRTAELFNSPQLYYSSEHILRFAMSEIMVRINSESLLFLLLQWVPRPLNAREMCKPKQLPILFTGYIQRSGNIQHFSIHINSNVLFKILYKTTCHY